MNRLIKLLILSVCLLCYGCKTVSKSTINVNLDVPCRDIKIMAVMRFDDEIIQREAVSGNVIKTISNPNAGQILADMMTVELLKWRKYHVLARSEIKREIKSGGEKEEPLVKRKDYATIGKILKADAVVFGKVSNFELSDMTVYARGNVSFTVECIDTRNGKILWSMEINESAPYKDEVELAGKAIKDVVEKLKKEME